MPGEGKVPATVIVSQLIGVFRAPVARCVFECGDGGDLAWGIKGAVNRGRAPMTVDGANGKYVEGREKW